MPSSTFLNLSQEKQERLLEAATKEFCRKSLGESSINQIIKEAGVARGSFYMYFQDKEDLFRYVLRGYVDEMLAIIEQLLLKEQGDIFAALAALFNYVEQRRERQQLGEVGAMSAILSRNAGMHKSAVLDVISPQEVFARLGQLVNTELLDLRTEEDLPSILALLMAFSGSTIYQGAQGPALTGADFRHFLDILKRGMAAKSTPATI